MLPSACLVLSLCATIGPDEQFHRFELANGVTAIVVHVPDAPKQSMFTVFPLSLATDPAGRAQWSHLLEHMIIRTTDAQGLAADGITFNGETGAEHLRVESFAAPADWKAALERHGKWLVARRVDPALLEQEKLVIADEEQTTARNRATHKWAVAAWNQAIRHGRDAVALHGDVREAVAPDVEAAMNALLPVGPGVLFATIGPVDPATLRPEIEAMLGSAAQDEVAADALKASNPRFAGAHKATWDLPTRHVMLWWKLPDREPATLAAAFAAGMGLQVRLFTPPAPPGAAQVPTPRSVVHANVSMPEGVFLVVNTMVPDGIDVDGQLKRARDAAADLGASPNTVISASRSLAPKLDAMPDFAKFRSLGGPGKASADLVEGNWLLPIVTQEQVWGRPRDAIAASLRAVDETTAQAVLELLQKEPMGTLVIEPGQ